jgi:hypothetical protein
MEITTEAALTLRFPKVKRSEFALVLICLGLALGLFLSELSILRLQLQVSFLEHPRQDDVIVQTAR